MKLQTQALLLLVAASLAGCAFGAREVEFPPERGYSADIAASLNHGPTAAGLASSAARSRSARFPWQIGEHDAN